MEKITMKEQVLRFVEAKGSARFTEIQEFIVDTNYGKGTYQNGYQIQRERKYNSKTGEWVEVRTSGQLDLFSDEVEAIAHVVEMGV